jgi:hypothetical protein
LTFTKSGKNTILAISYRKFAKIVKVPLFQNSKVKSLKSSVKIGAESGFSGVC